MHTPGPWTFTEERAGCYIGTVGCAIEGGADICDVVDLGTGGDAEANARLIAAAPDLYEACRDALAYLLARNLGDPAKKLARKIDAALQRAEGR